MAQYKSFFTETDIKTDDSGKVVAKDRQPEIFNKVGSTEEEENLNTLRLPYGSSHDSTDPKFDGKFREEKSKVKSMIKNAINAEFENEFNDKKKDPYLPELDVKKSKKMESYKSFYSEQYEESEILDNPDEKKDQERRKLLGSMHPEVMDPDEVKVDHVEISYGYTHNDPSNDSSKGDIPGHDATDSRFDGRMNEELVDDSHSMVKRAINADFTATDFNKEKKKPELKEPEKKKSKKKESTEYTPYKSAFGA